MWIKGESSIWMPNGMDNVNDAPISDPFLCLDTDLDDVSGMCAFKFNTFKHMDYYHKVCKFAHMEFFFREIAIKLCSTWNDR